MPRRGGHENADASWDHTQIALRVSLLTNVCIVVSMGAVAISTKSLALLSALVENMIDLMVQGLLCYAAAHTGKTQDRAKFPAGTSRFEPVAVIVAASMMMLISIVFIERGAEKLASGFASENPEGPNLSPEALTIAGAAVSTKVCIIFYTHWVLRRWPSAAVEAIHADNRNDVISNSFAITAYAIASTKPSLWYVDPIGAIVIFFLIMVSWFRMGKEQMMQLVGVCATPDFILEIKALCGRHHRHMTLDMIRAYHFGSKYLVELEVVVPGEMTVKDAHDIALRLQFKVEQRADVERAFVHVDYQQREYDEHLVSHEEDALLTYTGYVDTDTTDPTNDNGNNNNLDNSENATVHLDMTRFASATNSSSSSAHSNDDLLQHSTSLQDPLSVTVSTPRDTDESNIPFRVVTTV